MNDLEFHQRKLEIYSQEYLPGILNELKELYNAEFAYLLTVDDLLSTQSATDDEVRLMMHKYNLLYSQKRDAFVRGMVHAIPEGVSAKDNEMKDTIKHEISNIFGGYSYDFIERRYIKSEAKLIREIDIVRNKIQLLLFQTSETNQITLNEILSQYTIYPLIVDKDITFNIDNESILLLSSLFQEIACNIDKYGEQGTTIIDSVTTNDGDITYMISNKIASRPKHGLSSTGNGIQIMANLASELNIKVEHKNEDDTYTTILVIPANLIAPI